MKCADEGRSERRREYSTRWHSDVAIRSELRKRKLEIYRTEPSSQVKREPELRSQSIRSASFQLIAHDIGRRSKEMENVILARNDAKAKQTRAASTTTPSIALDWNATCTYIL